jgi:hypothetical protein
MGTDEQKSTRESGTVCGGSVEVPDEKAGTATNSTVSSTQCKETDSYGVWRLVSRPETAVFWCKPDMMCEDEIG